MEKRQEIIHAINDKFAEMSTETILFHQALADMLGFHITDHRCIHFLHKYGAMPAGRLSELTGLTTAAVTGIIDRLEQALLLSMKKCIIFCLYTLTVNWLSCLM